MKTWCRWILMAFVVVAAGSVAWSQVPPSATPVAGMSPSEQPVQTITLDESKPSAPSSGAPGAGSPVVAGEGERVVATVEELERLINAPEDARLGREVDEPDQPFSLFENKNRIEELLGKEPRYVYMPSGTDPMIVPWIRNRVMVEEYVAEANELMASGKYQEALAKVKLVLDRFSDADSEAVQKARSLKQQLEHLVDQQKTLGEMDSPKLPTGPRPTLPVWITENIRGLIYDVNDPAQSSVLIGDYILRIGESIPSYPGIKVKDIKKGLVVLDYQGEEYRLIVEGN